MLNILVTGSNGREIWYDLDDYRSAADLQHDIETVIGDRWKITRIEIQGDPDLEIKTSGVTLDDLYTAYGHLSGDDEESAAFLAYVRFQEGYLSYAAPNFRDAYRGMWRSLEDYVHESLMTNDEMYRTGFESNRGWRPVINMADFERGYYEVDTPYGAAIFQDV